MECRFTSDCMEGGASSASSMTAGSSAGPGPAPASSEAVLPEGSPGSASRARSYTTAQRKARATAEPVEEEEVAEVEEGGCGAGDEAGEEVLGDGAAI